jgi:small basic protein (TIGR04137 family)
LGGIPSGLGPADTLPSTGAPDPALFPSVIFSQNLIDLSQDVDQFTGLIMSQHPSLKGKGAIQAKRSVLKRFERVDLLKKRGQFEPNQSVIGLPKTKPED